MTYHIIKIQKAFTFFLIYYFPMWEYILYALVFLIVSIVLVLVILDFKLRKVCKNTKIVVDHGAIPVTFRDPIVDTVMGLFNVLNGSMTPKLVMKTTVNQLQRVRIPTKVRQGCFFNIHAITIWSPSVAKSVLFTPDIDVVKTQFGEFQERLIGGSILQAKGQDWKMQKEVLSPVFKWGHIKSLQRTMAVIGMTLVDRWRELGTDIIDVGQWVNRATLEAIGRCGFGFDFGALREHGKSKEFIQYEKFMKEGTNPIHSFERLDKLVGTRKGFDALFNNFEIFITGLINAKRENIQKLKESDDWEPKDILDFLIGAHEHNILTDKQLTDNMNTFFIAGHETTAGALTSALHLLARNPDSQEKARNEILEVCGDQLPTNDEIRNMPYLEACINETLRLFPPAPVLVRTAAREQQIGDLLVQKGTWLNIFIYLIHRDKDTWGPDAEEFRPERHLNENRDKNPRQGFIPFSMGPRQCIGNNFAMIQMKIFLAILLQRMRFEPHEESVVEYGEHMGVVFSVTPGCTLKVHPI